VKHFLDVLDELNRLNISTLEVPGPGCCGHHRGHR
jgi:hypothetical protein